MLASLKRLLSFILLLPLAHSASPTPPKYPTTVELNLVFPRNETYAPANLMPLAFALQNPQAAAPLDLLIEWKMGRMQGAGTSAAILEGDTDDFSRANLSTNDPAFMTRYTEKLNVTEGKFWVSWRVYNNNCSLTFNGNLTSGWYSSYNITYFTIAKGAQKPSLVTTPKTCLLIQSFTYNVTGSLPEPGLGVCAVTAASRPPATPCAVRIDDALASGIMENITNNACFLSRNSLPGCSSGASIIVPLGVGGAWWTLVAALMVFVYLF